MTSEIFDFFTKVAPLFISGASLFVSVKAAQYARSKDRHTALIHVSTALTPTSPIVVVSVTNTGFRTLRLKGYSWKFSFLGDTQAYIPIVDFQIYNGNNELGEGDEKQLGQDLDIFIEEMLGALSKNWIAGWFQILSLKVHARFTVFETQIDVPRDLKRLILSHYRREARAAVRSKVFKILRKERIS